ncbi:uncharacterized protein LOC108602276 [Drosophila busckii]|uniref:uncharacterized protein LOC108602276 n=1 Tax=Drosophila busckii TaxID=30019 RepID=UPI00083F4272|nr:uncharacterized protein LOC108602276 [Drosophila busckii]
MSIPKIPEWITEQRFYCLLKQNCKEFETINRFQCKPAVSCGENYLTIVLRILLEIQLKDIGKKETSYILKIPLINDRGNGHDFHDLFVTEADMYDRLVPELEALYAKYTQFSVKFKPDHLRFLEPAPNCDYILMEDLRSKGFKNIERAVGLDQKSMEAVLMKLAQWHAASAQRVSEMGDYEEKYQKSYFSPEHVKWIEHANMTFNMPFLECMQQYKLDPKQQLLITKYTARMTDMYMNFGRINQNQFCVLNHGDFWCNNFLLKFNENEIEDVCFVDFQLPKYGTPAQDLFGLLMTTPNLHIKLSKFDYFVEYYHQKLVMCLKALKYNGKIPSLSELQSNLRINGLWAFVCAQRMLPVALYPSCDASNVENFMGDSEIAMDFKRKMLLYPSYVKQINLILPWLIDKKLIN